jgi:excisionase family DNA binding protein
MPENPEDERLLLPAEVAAMFRVETRTVTRWAHTGRIPAGAVVRTLGNRRRFRAAVISRLRGGFR